MEDVYLDEYFIQQDIIEKRKRQDYAKQAQLHIIPNLEKKALEKFFEELTKEDKPNLAGKHVKTDFDAIKRAKEQLNNM
ncbi:hypothetical protein IC602_08995 [Virgibacillus halodenitrificans]|uniref:Uncharacterized protein n=2 Tax=Bacillaceae TaxID=186817 RepID=A0ABR7VLY9_VIRHA|nr:hypothetical protein X953_10180 [Virgibacillus sp. SK37]MBD1222746.1 hypothetical protein [Virgibacillus halodenitrificans]